jgi:hypothetical protein
MDARKAAPDIDLPGLARAYLDQWFPGGRSGATGLMVADTVLRWDEEYCRRVARWYDRGPVLAYDAGLRRLYDRFRWETKRQFHAIVDGGITVAPWLRPGQPYQGSAQLCQSVRASGTLYVYLTSEGHGAASSPGFHPMREPSGITVDGVEFAHNDLFRAVHDIFGHVMYGNSFTARGEFRATFCHMGMYSEDVHTVLFTEQVAQICWYYFGSHLERGGRHRYPDQKVFELPRIFLEQFKGMFAEAGATEPASPTGRETTPCPY